LSGLLRIEVGEFALLPEGRLETIGLMKVFLFVLCATIFEATGDAIVRMALHHPSMPARIGLFLLGAILLALYGTSLQSGTHRFRSGYRDVCRDSVRRLPGCQLCLLPHGSDCSGFSRRSFDRYRRFSCFSLALASLIQIALLLLDFRNLPIILRPILRPASGRRRSRRSCAQSRLQHHREMASAGRGCRLLLQGW
jgi:hypothetical protein